jgi:rhodanese-related sulfurtransferase
MLSVFLYADAVSMALQINGVRTNYKEKEIFISRMKNPKCLKVGVTPENVFGGNLAGRHVPRECKKTFVTSLGVVQAMKIDDEIVTVGEIEVLKFLQLLDFEPEKYIIVDARNEEWFQQMAIPHAVNIPYLNIKYYEDFPDEIDKNMALLNVKKDKKGTLDFSEAKEVIVYCNGSWCPQSVKMIKALAAMGYPKKKLFWYRGGLQDWIGAGFTVMKGK